MLAIVGADVHDFGMQRDVWVWRHRAGQMRKCRRWGVRKLQPYCAHHHELHAMSLQVHGQQHLLAASPCACPTICDRSFWRSPSRILSEISAQDLSVRVLQYRQRLESLSGGPPTGQPDSSRAALEPLQRHVSSLWHAFAVSFGLGIRLYLARPYLNPTFSAQRLQHREVLQAQ